MKKILLLLVLISNTVFAQRTLIHCGTLIDGKNKQTQSQVTIVVEGNKIVAVEKGFTTASANDKVIDLTNKTVMPGLIDLHVHLEGETSKDQLVKDSRSTKPTSPSKAPSTRRRI